jgi:hypothetical protein
MHAIEIGSNGLNKKNNVDTMNGVVLNQLSYNRNLVFLVEIRKAMTKHFDTP